MSNMVLRDATHLKRKNNVALEGIVEVGSSNEMSAVVLDQRVCTGRPLLERKNLRRSLGNCCLSRRWLRETAFSSILSRMITPMSGSHSNQCFLVCCIRRLRCFVKCSTFQRLKLHWFCFSPTKRGFQNWIDTGTETSCAVS